MLPDANGFSVCEEIRSTDPLVPVIMLTARSQEADKIRGLDAGADDYVTKPFSVGELVARINAIFRRLHRTAPPASEIEIGAAVDRPAQTRADAQGEDPHAVVLRDRAAAPAVGAQRPAGHARGDPGEDLGRLRPRQHPQRRQLRRQAAQEDRRRRRRTRATSSRSTAPATSWCRERALALAVAPHLPTWRCRRGPHAIRRLRTTVRQQRSRTLAARSSRSALIRRGRWQGRLGGRRRRRVRAVAATGLPCSTSMCTVTRSARRISHRSGSSRTTFRG